MNLSKCDKCGNRNVMCFLCENNKHYRETKRSYDRVIRNNAIDEFADRLKKLYQAYDIDLCLQDNDHLSYTNSCIALESYIDEIAEQMKIKGE